ncbi:MAG: serine hydrolase domain-containing protein [Acidimicrobiia bacterium]
MRLLIIGLFLASTLQAQRPAVFTDPDRADKVAATAATVAQIFREYSEQRHMPGFVYGFVLDGELVYSGSFGLANLDEKIAADTKSLFRIASMSKSFTALAILQLRDEGRLSLDDPVSQYLPEMKALTYLTTDAPEITIRHLLTHSAGFPEDNPWGDRQLADSDEELMELIAGGVSFSNVPGVEYEYSNLGFALLGQIVRVVSGMDFQDYTAEHIFEPLGMNSTVWEYENAPGDHLALGYDWVDEAWVNIPLEHHGSFGAMGGLITSIEDFTAYVGLHLSAWPPRSDADAGPLKRSSLREMHHPWRFAYLVPAFSYPNGRECASARAYAYGLTWMEDCDGKVMIGHSGGLPGFGSNWTMLPEYGLAVMSFDNRTYGGTSWLNMGVLDTILALTGLEPRRLPVSDILEQRKNQLVAMLPDWEGAESSGLFAENFFMDNRLSDVVERTRELYEEAGEIMGVGEMVPVNQLRGSFVLEGEKKNIQVFFTLTPERDPLIQQVRMRSRER